MKLNDDKVEGRYATWLKQAIDFVAPKNLFLVAGRGTAKTTDILADRFQNICLDMPRAMFALVSDTYVNNLRNIVPSLLEGLRERKGWVEGVHYVTDQRPPDSFDIPYKPIVNFKHTISIYNGCFINLGSLDQVSSLAGNSYQHIFGDESKYLNPQKLKKLMPARRGFPDVAHSIYYRGLTFTTDMPNVVEGEFDWILDQEKNFDIEQIKLALYAGSELNKIRHEYYDAIKNNKNQKDLDLIQKNYTRWYEKWYRARDDSTFFYVVSSFVNADILQPGYFKDVLDSDGIESFKSSIISLKPELKKSEKFYPNLAPHHFYYDGVDNDYYMKFDLKDKIEESSVALKYLNPKQELEAGLDFGRLISMVIGQDSGRYYYIVKNLFVLAPESSKEIGRIFVKLFQHHRVKRLKLYYDRSGNQYASSGRDWASEIKQCIEVVDGEKTGWDVVLMSKGQSVISQEAEYKLAKNLLGNYYNRLPEIKIDGLQCAELKRSMKLARTKLKVDKYGVTHIHKDKSSEKTAALHKLPKQSTNMSDAFKYLICRPEWLKISSGKKSEQWNDPGIIDPS